MARKDNRRRSPGRKKPQSRQTRGLSAKKKLAGIIIACTVAIVVTIVLFSIKPWQPTYTLSVSVSPPQAGSVSPSSGLYKRGAQVTLTASPASGYTFDNWEGGASGATTNMTVTMNEDYSITANFLPVYNLTISSTAGGSITEPGEGTFTYVQGTEVNLVAEAEEGYRFIDWTGDVTTIADVNAPSTTMAMTGDYSTIASFEPESQEAVHFPDPKLEAAIREAIDKPTGNIYPSDLAELTTLYAWEKNITDLDGLEHCIDLTWLTFRNNHISDISPLVNNPGLGDGDTVDLRDNPLSLQSTNTYIPQLQDRGVTIYDVYHQKQKAYPEPPPMIIDTSKQYTATIETEKGNLVLELFARDVSMTVNNFVFLARDGFYDGLTFHRVVREPSPFVVQGGCPIGDGTGSPGYRFDDEFSEHTHVTGALSMANSGPNTNGSQFFITLAPQHHLDGRHSVFGRLIEGMDVLESIEQGDVMTRITIDEE